jgi:hypothetical protein
MVHFKISFPKSLKVVLLIYSTSGELDSFSSMRYLSLFFLKVALIFYPLYGLKIFFVFGYGIGLLEVCLLSTDIFPVDSIYTGVDDLIASLF